MAASLASNGADAAAVAAAAAKHRRPLPSMLPSAMPSAACAGACWRRRWLAISGAAISRGYVDTMPSMRRPAAAADADMHMNMPYGSHARMQRLPARRAALAVLDDRLIW